MDISEEQRRAVAQTLPEVEDIEDDPLRTKVIDAWAFSLSQSSFHSIDEIRASGNPDSPKMKVGTQTDHIRGVTQLAVRSAIH